MRARVALSCCARWVFDCFASLWFVCVVGAFVSSTPRDDGVVGVLALRWRCSGPLEI